MLDSGLTITTRLKMPQSLEMGSQNSSGSWSTGSRNGKKRQFLMQISLLSLFAQTNNAMIHMLRCQASLIEDLITDTYKFVLISRFQTDPLGKSYTAIGPISTDVRRTLPGLSRRFHLKKNDLKVKCLKKKKMS